jgi:high-affinity nickel-transport protein
MHEDRRPLGVGLYFSLGHSTVVFLMTLAVALAAQAMAASESWLHDAGRLVGTTVSGVFLYAIGVLNLIVMVDVYRVFRRLQRGDATTADLEARLTHGGVITRWCGGLFRLVRRPWQMYLVGFLFGLGFDTATEIGLLTTAGIAASQSLPLAGVLALPVVFAAGMTLLDTADGVLMCGAYGWAFANPLRKVFYNLTITGLSVAVALIVGTIQRLSMAADRLALPPGGVWDAVRNFDAAATGYLVVGLFIASWVVSVGLWKVGRFDQEPG